MFWEDFLFDEVGFSKVEESAGEFAKESLYIGSERNEDSGVAVLGSHLVFFNHTHGQLLLFERFLKISILTDCPIYGILYKFLQSLGEIGPVQDTVLHNEPQIFVGVLGSSIWEAT